ncbi:DUF1127 domain-containing protein [Kaustia mangrovi]|uniref:DUF1127 domain-containing protein n=1 Tax=Kaustia mangrovi TaxID=2593653 RepID=A0A7S8C1X0_9HYPH|nr:DUF1127 domain-containing protein [Kaustia mangrovi]QPC41869.1 DUF1127 domain-containing protein [Kaustia mangrovi]
MGSIDTIWGYIRETSSWAPRPKAAMSGVFARLETVRARRRSRRALLDMTEEQLQDIGISRDEALKEAYRPFWDTDREVGRR